MSQNYVKFAFWCFYLGTCRSGSSVVDNTLAYQSSDRKIDPPLSGLSDETLNRGPMSV